MTNAEIAFLKYARAILGRGRTSEGCCPLSEWRWPGYVGKNYKDGCSIMFIGSIHRSDALLKSEKTHQEVQAFRSLIPAWLKRQICDVTFLEKLQAGYEAAIPDWTGPVWSQFRRIKHELVGLPEDVGWDRIAFTNIAKCHGKTTLVETLAKN